MGQLKPGSTLIYERVGDTVYRRETGADPATRTEVGHDYDPRTQDGRPLREHIQEDQLWGAIRRAARANPALQDILDHAIMIYHLTRTDKSP
jgi:hypothetical protein